MCVCARARTGVWALARHLALTRHLARIQPLLLVTRAIFSPNSAEKTTLIGPSRTMTASLMEDAQPGGRRIDWGNRASAAHAYAAYIGRQKTRTSSGRLIPHPCRILFRTLL